MAAKPVAVAKEGMASADIDPEVAVKEARLEVLLLGQPVSERTRATVISQSNDSTAAIQALREFQGGGGPGKGGGGGQDAALLSGDYNNPTLPRLGLNGGGLLAPKNAIPDDRQAAIMAGLLLGSPEFQRR